MFVRSILSSYYRLLVGAMLALAVFALTGCNEKAAEQAAPGRPVLVATVHYEAETPERSFVGTIKPRIETDMGFRVPGKVAKRLVEVGQTVEIGQPLATLDEVDLKLQAEQAEAEFTRRHRRAGAGRRRRTTRQGFARKGLDHRRPNGHQPRRRRRSACAAQPRRAFGRTDQKLALLCKAGRRYPRRRHRYPGRTRPGRRLRPDRDPRRALCREGSCGRDPRDPAWPRQGRHRHRDALVGRRQEIRREAARGRTFGRSRDANLSRKILAA